MTATFRCEHCGAMMTQDGRAGQKVRCPHCGAKVRLPTALEAMPRPIVPPQGQEDGHPPDEAAEVEPALACAAAAAVPWLFSTMLHVGVFLIMFFLVMLSAPPVKETVVYRPTDPVANKPGPSGRMSEPRDSERRDPSNKRPSTTVRGRQRPKKIEIGQTEKPVPLASQVDGSEKGSDGPLGLTNQIGGFFNIGPGGPGGGAAFHIVYVIDGSGSMSVAFDAVRAELIRSIAHLDRLQDFHVIVFANNQVLEGPGGRLAEAELPNRQAAGRFIRNVAPGGQTEALPALQRAMQVLRYADPHRPGKCVFLLTDADFAGVTGGSAYRTRDGRRLQGNEAVVQYLRENAPDDVSINTILFRLKDASAHKVLQTIAGEHHGQFKYVSPDE